MAIEIKRRGEIDGVEQLARYLEFLERDRLRPVRGVFVAQQIKPQAWSWPAAAIACVEVDYDAAGPGLRGPAAVLSEPGIRRR